VTQTLSPLRPFAPLARRAGNAFDLVTAPATLSWLVTATPLASRAGFIAPGAIARRATPARFVALSEASASRGRRTPGEATFAPVAPGIFAPAAG
jgi:hypothetical protein